MTTYWRWYGAVYMPEKITRETFLGGIGDRYSEFTDDEVIQIFMISPRAVGGVVYWVEKGQNK